MKRIAILLGCEQSYGGTFQYTLATLGALSTFPKDEFHVIAFYKNILWKEYCDNFKIKSLCVRQDNFIYKGILRIIRILRLPIPLIRKINKYISPLGRIFNIHKIKLCIYPSQEAYSYEIEIPALSTIHDLMHRYEKGFPEVGSIKEYNNRETHYSNMCKWAKGILVDSEVGKNQVYESYDKVNAKLFVLPYIAPDYIYNDNYNVDTKEIETLKQILPSKYIFYPAQFWEHKNHINLLKAISLLKNSYPDISLVLVGSRNNGYNQAMSYIEHMNLMRNVVILGYVSNEAMKYLYKKARALVMPTFFGPTNIPQLEAFELGCPVATSKIYGIPEQVGDAAILFDPRSVGDIAKCIEALWTDGDLCKSLVERGKKRSENWSQKQYAERLYEIVVSLNKDKF